MGIFDMVVIVAFFTMLTGTIHKYMDHRMRMADRLSRGVDRSVMQAIEELRAEVAALKQHEAEVVLSFDSTLQNVDARLKHMERKSLGAGGVESALVTNDRASGIGNSGLGVRR